MSLLMVTMQEMMVLKVEILREIRTLMQATPHLRQGDLLKTWEVRQMLGISLATLRNMRDQGKIEYTKIGGLLFYRKQHIVDLIEENKKPRR